MAITRYSPFRDIMPREMRRFLEGPGMDISFMDPLAALESFAPPMDVYAKGPDMVMRMELPGVDLRDLDITLSDHMLHVTGERRQDKETKERDYYRRERFYGHFERNIPIPDKVKESDIDATYRDGVLEVTVKGAVEEAAPTKHIEVKTEAAEPEHIEPGPAAGPPPEGKEGPK